MTNLTVASRNFACTHLKWVSVLTCCVHTRRAYGLSGSKNILFETQIDFPTRVMSSIAELKSFESVKTMTSIRA
jgi:hypothetical protein